MGKKRRAVTPDEIAANAARAKARAVTQDKNAHVVHYDDTAAKMDPPNHTVTPAIDPTGKRGAKYRWPMMMLMYHPETEHNKIGVFIDESHGAEHWFEWADHPPSWMDPLVFVKMCRKRPEIMQLLERAYQKNDDRYATQVAAEMDKVFEEEYLPWLFEKFPIARDMLSQWLIRNYADWKTDPLRPKKKLVKKVVRRIKRSS